MGWFGPMGVATPLLRRFAAAEYGQPLPWTVATLVVTASVVSTASEQPDSPGSTGVATKRAERAGGTDALAKLKFPLRLRRTAK